MKRIAAIIALAFAVVALPATAMASTSGSGAKDGNSGYVNPGGPRLVMCPLPRGVYVKQTGKPVQISYANGQVEVAYRKVDGKKIRFFCPLPRRLPRPPVQVCASGTVTFDMPPSSGTFTEYSGPQLYSGEKFAYNGTMYTVATVSASVFTLEADGSRYVNGKVSVVDGSASVGCPDIPAGS